MKKILFIILLNSLVFNNSIHAQITATQMGMLDFKLSQSLTSIGDGWNHRCNY